MLSYVDGREEELVKDKDFVKNLLSTIYPFLSDALHKVEENARYAEEPER